mgnify:FL=1
MTNKRQSDNARSGSTREQAERLAPENDIKDNLPKDTLKLLQKKLFYPKLKDGDEEELSNDTLVKFNYLKNSLKSYTQKKSNEDFLTFVRKEAPKLVPDFKMGRHIQVLCHKLQQVVDGDCKRLMVFLPPRSSKSVICSKLFPAWYIGRNPSHEIMSVSHSDQLASDFGRSVRDIVNSEDFDRMFSGV